jgi:hypothetical protein
MPRVNDGGPADGLRVPGLYRALLEKERRRCEEPDPRRVLSDAPNDPAPVFRRSRKLLDALEAGKAVVMPRWLVGSGRSVPPVVLPWDRSVDYVRVSPDDGVRPAEYSREHWWPGGPASD